MANLVPGVLLKLLQHMNTEVKVGGEEGCCVLQVVSIVPALAAGELFPDQGFYLKVSDSSHATFVSLPDEHVDLILCDDIQLGQFILVDSLQSASPVPLLKGVRPVPGRHPCVGSPEDVIATNFLGFPHNNTTCSRDSKHLENANSPKKTAASATASIKGKSWSTKLNTISYQDKKPPSSHSRSKSQIAKPVLSLDIKKEPFTDFKSLNPSSPMSCYSLPTSFDKFSKQTKIKGVDRESPRAGSLEKASSRSANKVAMTKNIVHGIESGVRALRKSWEVKNREDSKRRVAKQDPTPQVGSSAAPRKSIPSERVTSKSNIKPPLTMQSPGKKFAANGNLYGKESLSKPKTSIGKSSTELTNNGSPGNFVKAPINSLELSECRISWNSLPSSLAKLGKEVMQHRDAAQVAAIEAMQEASNADSLLQCLSSYTELTLSAKEDNPQPAVEQFLTLNENLTEICKVAESLSKIISIQTNSLDRRNQAASWVQAASATNLSSFSVCNKSSSASTRENSSKNNTVRKEASKALPSHAEWIRGNSLQEVVELAETLRMESQDWFLQFVEKFLEVDVDTSLYGNGQLGGMLSQLKSINDWLDKIGWTQDEEPTPRVSSNTIDRLRKKIYEYLLRQL